MADGGHDADDNDHDDPADRPAIPRSLADSDSRSYDEHHQKQRDTDDDRWSIALAWMISSVQALSREAPMRIELMYTALQAAA
jgi:hypothetical protein